MKKFPCGSDGSAIFTGRCYTEPSLRQRLKCPEKPRSKTGICMCSITVMHGLCFPLLLYGKCVREDINYCMIVDSPVLVERNDLLQQLSTENA